MTDATTTAAVHTYLLVGQDPLIQQDLGQAIAEFDPIARIVVAAAPTLDAIVDLGRLCLVFVELPADAFTGTPLSQAIAAHQASVVLTGASAERTQADGWFKLPYPFATSDVHAILRAA